MVDKDKDRARRLTRRGFIKHGSKVGAGVALSPLVLNLTACSNDKAAQSGPLPGASVTPDGTGSAVNTAPANGMSPGATGSGMAGSSSAAGAAGQSSGTQPMAGQAGGTSSTGTAGGSGMPNNNTPPAMASNAIAAGAVLLGLYKGDGVAAVKAAASKLDFSWLKSGDTVLIKVATNSQYTHPTVTSPNGVRGMIAELKARGAGKVIVADQAGVEHVRASAMGRDGKTSDMWQMNGMTAAAADAELHFFDDQPFDTGNFSATLPDGHHWPRGMYLPGIVKQVDHIIYMPRIGTHILAGLSLSHKSAIGWLRDDSRHDLHNDAQDYYEKYTEVSYAKEIADRFRMTVTVSEAILLHGGPDTGTNYKLDPVVVTASTRMANHDAVASSILVTLNQNISTVDPGTMTYSAGSAPTNNAFFANGLGVATGAAGPWTSGSTQTMYTAHAFEQGVSKDRAITRGWALSGGKPTSIQVVLDGETLDSMLKTGLTTHGEGLYKLG